MVSAEQHITIAGTFGSIESLNQQIVVAVVIDIAKVDKAVAEVVGGSGTVKREAAGQVGEVLVAALQIDVLDPA